MMVASPGTALLTRSGAANQHRGRSVMVVSACATSAGAGGLRVGAGGDGVAPRAKLFIFDVKAKASALRIEALEGATFAQQGLVVRYCLRGAHAGHTAYATHFCTTSSTRNSETEFREQC